MPYPRVQRLDRLPPPGRGSQRLRLQCHGPGSRLPTSRLAKMNGSLFNPLLIGLMPLTKGALSGGAK